MGGDRRSPPHHRGRGGSGGRSKSTRGGASLSGLIGGFDQSFKLKNGNSIAKKLTGLIKESEIKVISQGAALEEERNSWVENRESIEQVFNKSDGTAYENQDSGKANFKNGTSALKKPSGLTKNLEDNCAEKDSNLKTEAQICIATKVVLDQDCSKSGDITMDEQGSISDVCRSNDTEMLKLEFNLSNHGESHDSPRNYNNESLGLENPALGTGGNLQVTTEIERRMELTDEADNHGNSVKGMNFKSHNPLFWVDDISTGMNPTCDMIVPDNLDREYGIPDMGNRKEHLDMGDRMGVERTNNPVEDFCMEGVWRNVPGVQQMNKPIFEEECAHVHEKVVQSNEGNKGPALDRSGKQTPNAWKKPSHVLVDWFNMGRATDDGKFVTLNMEAVNSNQSKLEKALVGRLIGRKLPFSILQTELKKRWEVYGDFRFLMMGEECFTCIFNSVDARDAVLMGGPWLIGGYIVRLDRWSPSFSQESMSGLTAPVWIRFPKLPLLYWDNDNLARIASMVGQPLWIDAQTSMQRRCAYARVCVRLDLAQKLPNGVWIHGVAGNFFQSVEYEGIHQVCFNCGHIGHKEDRCGINMLNGKDRRGDSPGKATASDEAVFGWKKNGVNSAVTSGGWKKSAAILKNDVNNLKEMGSTSIPTITMNNCPLVISDCSLNGAVNVGCDQIGFQSDEVEDPGHGPWIFVSRKKGQGRGKFRANTGSGITHQSWGPVNREELSRVKDQNESSFWPVRNQNLKHNNSNVADIPTDVGKDSAECKGKEIAVDNRSLPSLVFSSTREEGRLGIGEGKFGSFKMRNYKERGSNRVPSAREISKLGPITSGSRKRRKGDSDWGDLMDLKEFSDKELDGTVMVIKEGTSECGGDASPLVN